ncbi:MAG: glycosyltransferase family 39 protein, partial [Gallionella sp.]|nr:glycosyltransferase family 39 protein [Gallionella sp.]
TALLATLAIKLVLAYVLPMSGDEAYFIVWAKHLDFGFYDHPPMVGWILHLLLYLGSSEVVLRLPAILLATLIGLGIYRLLKPYDEIRAALVATLFLIAPLNVLNVLVSTDTPLILFVFLSVASLYKALHENSKLWYALSGVFLGMAFLSKYFAVLLILGYLAYFIFSSRSKEKIQGLILLLLASLPFALINFYWNYTHCWDNILFNLYNRNEGEELSASKVAAFLGTQIYLTTPPVIYFLFKHRAEFRQKLKLGHFGLFAFVFLLPMAIFALLSVKKVIGLHWVLAFYPFFYLLLCLYLSREELLKSLKFMAWFSAAHLAAIAVIAVLPMETWKQNKLYDGIVFMFQNEAVVEEIRPYEQQGFLLAADGYTPAAIVSYHYGKNFFVFGEGSHFARQDDMITDFRQLGGRNILILKKSAPELTQYVPYFQSVETKQFMLRGVTFYLVLGYGFDYASYKELVLKPAKEKYYKIPAFLPHAPCYFCEKYFPEEVR